MSINLHNLISKHKHMTSSFISGNSLRCGLFLRFRCRFFFISSSNFSALSAHLKPKGVRSGLNLTPTWSYTGNFELRCRQGKIWWSGKGYSIWKVRGGDVRIPKTILDNFPIPRVGSLIFWQFRWGWYARNPTYILWGSQISLNPYFSRSFTHFHI